MLGWLKCKLGFHEYGAVLHLGSDEDWEKNYVVCNRCDKKFEKGTGGVGWGIT